MAILACLLATLQIYLRRRIRYNATHFRRASQTPPRLAPIEAWTLAVNARYLMQVALPVDSFRPPEFRRVATLTAVLAKDWGIKDRAALITVLDHLQTTGYRSHCSQLTGRPQEEFLAWDLMRIILLAWAGLNLDWMSPEEFSSAVGNSGFALQAAFPDWASAAASYEAGLQLWATEAKLPKLARQTHLVFQTLLSDPASPWQTTPWRTPLTATISE